MIYSKFSDYFRRFSGVIFAGICRQFWWNFCKVILTYFTQLLRLVSREIVWSFTQSSEDNFNGFFKVISTHCIQFKRLILRQIFRLFYLENCIFFTLKTPSILLWKLCLFYLENRAHFTLKTLYILTLNNNETMPILPWKRPSILPCEICLFYFENAIYFTLKTPSILPWTLYLH